MLPPGQVILGLRERLGMTRQEFARALGWSPATIARWESGKVAPSRLAFKTILAFAEERGVRWRPKTEEPTGGLPAVVTAGPAARPVATPAPERFVTVSADRPRWSAEATVRFSAAPRGERSTRRYGRRTAVIVATVCAVLLLGVPAGRHAEEPVVRPFVRHRIRAVHDRTPAPVATAAPATPVVARLDAVLVMGAERRATFRVDDRSLSLAQGDRLGSREIVAVRGDGVVLRDAVTGSRMVRLGDDVRVD